MRIFILGFFLFIVVGSSGLALTPNLPAGTLGSGMVVNTQFGPIPDGVRYAPLPALPSSAGSGRGVYVIEISVARGIADNVRVLQSSGSKTLDDAAIAALLKWRLKPRAFYKLTVPIEFMPSGRVRVGS
jgi:TonB family protein